MYTIVKFYTNASFKGKSTKRHLYFSFFFAYHYFNFRYPVLIKADLGGGGKVWLVV